MATIAIYSVKGGVGKSTLAAALAWNAASLSRRRTLLWDLDVQGAAAFLLGQDAPPGHAAAAVLSRNADPAGAIRPTACAGLDLLPADDSLRDAGGMLERLGRKRRLQRLTQGLAGTYERIVLDCPPVLGELSAQILRAADVVVVPLPPSPLSRRALGTVRAELARVAGKREGGPPPVLPVFSMVDLRRKLHRAALAEEPAWPVVPMASQIEQMAQRRLPIGLFAGTSAPAQAIAAVWTGIERKLAVLSQG